MDPWRDTGRGCRWRGPVCAVVLGMSCLGAGAQTRLKPDVTKLYGGVYATACQDASSPRVRVLPDALVVQHGSQRFIGRQPQSAFSYYGKVAPPQFRVGLLSQLPAGGALDFIVSEDKRGLYISVQGDAKAQAALGKALLGPRYRRCDSPTNTAAATPPMPAQDEQASDAEKMLLDPQFRTAYLRALGALARERWLSRLEGPRPPTRQVHLDGTEYQLIAVCKPHDCADHNTVLLYSAEQGAVFGKVYQAGKSTPIGDPSPTIAAALDRIWATEWRRR